jgi:hypothetical protein
MIVRLCAIAGVVAAAGIAPAVAKEKLDVTVSYIVAPPRPLPAGLSAVAVLDAGVQSRGPRQDERERKWSQIAGDMIEGMLQSSSDMPGGLQVVDRGLTRQILAEQDLKLAGLVEGAAATQAGRLLNVQGLITSSLTIQIETQETARQTVDWGAVLGGAVRLMAPPAEPRSKVRVYRDRRTGRVLYAERVYSRGYQAAPAPRMPTRAVREISRRMMVQCKFALVDATTGQSLVVYAPPPFRKEDESAPSFAFGGEGELNPIDPFIGELVERAVGEFVAQLVPSRVEVTYQLVGKDQAEAGIRALRADDYAAAITHFQAALAKKFRPESLFALGVTYELMGSPAQALDVYRRLTALEDVDSDDLEIYLAAKKRLTEHLPRIVGAAPPPVPGGPVIRDLPPTPPGDD